MTPAEFKIKWRRYQGKETSGYQSHFDDLCRMLGLSTPNEADPSGKDFFCFQKRVVKDAELFRMHEGDGDETETEERGFADVWKKGCFAWEYKGKKKNLDEAYRQLLRYREDLQNPPLLIVCDFDRYIIRTNFNGTVMEAHEFTNELIDRPDVLRMLRSCFEDPDYLKPQRTTAQVTETLAAQIGKVALSLQKRESVELADAKSRKEVSVAQRKNLRIARFLNRIVFCMFAEDTGLLPKDLFTEVLKASLHDPRHFTETTEELFKKMQKGGRFGNAAIRHFNGHLFDDFTVFELTEEEIKLLADAAEADWQFIQPSIMGTLFERALDESHRAQLGAHYTSEADIRTLVEPVLMQPFRREWSQIKGQLAAAYNLGKGNPAQREQLVKFQKKLSSVTVLDPACGSGNFLYVSLQLLLGLEKEVVSFATQLGFRLTPQVDVQQLRAIEINPYAYELAQVSVQIGYLQWRRDNGFDNDRTPVLQVLKGFQNEDALLEPHFHSKAKTLKQAQEGEHKGEDSLKFYTEREWPEADVIVSNPPFLGGSRVWEELGRHYQKELWRTYEGRVPGFADLCCYWFEKARCQIEAGKCRRAGLLATQGIRGGANREVLKRIQETGDIFFAESDRNWILEGANVHVSMVGFDKGEESDRQLDGKAVAFINANLTCAADTVQARPLLENLGISFIGTKKAGDFNIPEGEAVSWLNCPNPHGKPNSDVLRPWLNGSAIVKRPERNWIIDAGVEMLLSTFSGYELPSRQVSEKVRPERDKNNRAAYRDKWWIHAEARPGMRKAFSGLNRFLVTSRVSKHRIFVWADTVVLPDDGTFTFARMDEFFFGILQSRFHEVWSRAQATQVRERESGLRYTPNTCFETFPFPRSTPDQETAIAAAAKELNDLRERWLNPPEWTVEKVLEFPGSSGGPWQRYLDPKTVDPKTGVGTVRYPRLEPRDAECAAKLKQRTLTNLYNERPAWLDLAHRRLDIAVARAYGWDDFSDVLENKRSGQIYDFKTKTIALLDTDAKGLAEAEAEFEKAFAEEILERLLALNLERAAEEEKAAKTKKPKAQRAKRQDELV